MARGPQSLAHPPRKGRHERVLRHEQRATHPGNESSAQRLGYLFVSSFAQPDRNLNVIGAISSGSSVGTTTTKDTAATHWMYDPATASIYTTVGATRYYLTARKPAESVGTDRRVYITSSFVGGGYQQWAITPDYVNNRGLGSTGNAEILGEISPGVVTVGPYFTYPAGTKWAWHTHP
jgi:hypothetical protein